MTYAAEDIVRSLKEAREAKGLSQRDLEARTGVPQSHISKIENGGTDIRLSSLIEIARALDLDLKLVPRKAVPAVDTVVRSAAPVPAPKSGEAQRQLRQWADLTAVLRQAYPDVSALNQIQKTLSQLRTFPTIDNSALEAIRNATRPLRELAKANEKVTHFSQAAKVPSQRIKKLVEAAQVPAQRLQEIDEATRLTAEHLKQLRNAANSVQQLRNALVHNISDQSEPLPAYRLDDDEGGGNG